VTEYIDPNTPLVQLNTKQLAQLGSQMLTQEKWDRRFLDIARQVSTWSKDPSTQVGAVLVDRMRQVVGTGFNGFPRGVDDHVDRYLDRPTKYAMVVHAELNAILQAGHRARGGTIYVYPSFGPPSLCTGCAKAVIQSGVVRSVGFEPVEGDERAERWADELAMANIMCQESGITVDLLAEDAEPTLADKLVTLRQEWGRSDMSNDELANRVAALALGEEYDDSIQYEL